MIFPFYLFDAVIVPGSFRVVASLESPTWRLISSTEHVGGSFTFTFSIPAWRILTECAKYNARNKRFKIGEKLCSALVIYSFKETRVPVHLDAFWCYVSRWVLFLGRGFCLPAVSCEHSNLGRKYQLRLHFPGLSITRGNFLFSWNFMNKIQKCIVADK